MLCCVTVVLMKLEVVTSPSNESGDWNVVVFSQPNMVHCMHDLPASVHTTSQPNYCSVHAGSASAAKQTRTSCTLEAWPARALLIGCRPRF
jgi:hypothetical protein